MKLRTKIIGVAACAFALCVALAGCASAPAGNDAANFQGDWILSSGTVDGQEATEETMAQAQEMGLSLIFELQVAFDVPDVFFGAHSPFCFRHI